MADLAAVACALLGVQAGCALGLVAGLVPGLHANNLTQGLLGARPLFMAAMAWAVAGTGAAAGPQATFGACGFLVGIALGHAFTDEIPAVFLGAPDPDTALSVLPGHRLMLAGHGESAVAAAAVGSALGVLFSLPLVPLLAAILGPPLGLYGAAERAIPVLILVAAGLLVATESGRPDTRLTRGQARLAALAVLVASGALGELVVFGGVVLPEVRLVATDSPVAGGHMLSLFAGLFGLPTLLLAALSPASAPSTTAPARPLRLGRRQLAKSAALGTAAGAAVGWLPGVGAAQAAVLATAARDARRGRRGLWEGEASQEDAAHFLVVQSAVATANLVFNLVALFALTRVRSGTMAAVDQVGAGAVVAWDAAQAPPDLLVGLLVGAALALPMCLAGALAMGRACASRYPRLPPRAMAAAVLAGIVALIAVLEGGAGLAVAGAAVCLGLVPPLAGVKRVHLMGAILLPVAMRLASGG